MSCLRMNKHNGLWKDMPLTNGYLTAVDFLWTDGTAVRTAFDFLWTDGSAVCAAEEFLWTDGAAVRTAEDFLRTDGSSRLNGWWTASERFWPFKRIAISVRFPVKGHMLFTLTNIINIPIQLSWINRIKLACWHITQTKFERTITLKISQFLVEFCTKCCVFFTWFEGIIKYNQVESYVATLQTEAIALHSRLVTTVGKKATISKFSLIKKMDWQLKTFFERIARTVWTARNFFEQIARAVRTAHIFLTDSSSRSNGWAQFFFNR